MKNNELRDDCRINIFTLQLQSKISQFDRTVHWCILQGYANMFTAKIFNCPCTVFNKSNEMKCQSRPWLEKSERKIEREFCTSEM